MWRALSHPNVLPLLGVTMTENQLVMVTEWIMGGNIMEFTRANTNADWLELVSLFSGFFSLQLVIVGFHS